MGSDGHPARMAGHDINYLSLTGELYSIGDPGQAIDVAKVEGISYLPNLVGERRLVASGATNAAPTWSTEGRPSIAATRRATPVSSRSLPWRRMFFAELVRRLDPDEEVIALQYDEAALLRLHRFFESRFTDETRVQWSRVFEGTDACVTPVMHLPEVAQHPQVAGSGVVVSTGRGQFVPEGAPRFHRERSARLARLP